MVLAAVELGVECFRGFDAHACGRFKAKPSSATQPVRHPLERV